MRRSKRKWQLTIVDFLVGVAVVMILTALVVPMFVRPDRRAASRTAVSGPAKTAHR